MLKINSLIYYPRTKLVDIQLSDLETITLDAELVFEKGLKEGLEINDNYLAELMQLTLNKSLRQQAFNYLAIKHRTVAEMSIYLKQKLAKNIDKFKYKDSPVNETLISKIINELIERKYLNDFEYAKLYIEQQMSNLKSGKRALLYKLSNKGIDKIIINHLLGDKEFITTDKTNDLINESMKKLANIIKSRGYDKKKAKEFLFRRLISKGHNYQEVRNKIDGWLASEYNV